MFTVYKYTFAHICVWGRGLAMCTPRSTFTSSSLTSSSLSSTAARNLSGASGVSVPKQKSYSDFVFREYCYKLRMSRRNDTEYKSNKAQTIYIGAHIVFESICCLHKWTHIHGIVSWSFQQLITFSHRQVRQIHQKIKHVLINRTRKKSHSFCSNEQIHSRRSLHFQFDYIFCSQKKIKILPLVRRASIIKFLSSLLRFHICHKMQPQPHLDLVKLQSIRKAKTTSRSLFS